MLAATRTSRLQARLSPQSCDDKLASLLLLCQPATVYGFGLDGPYLKAKLNALVYQSSDD